MKIYRAGDILTLERRPVAVDPVAEYQEIGVRSFGRGIFHKEPILGADLGNKRVFAIRSGDLLFNNVFAWEGAVALAGPTEQGRIGSHRFMTYVADPTVAEVRYLRYFFLSEVGLVLLGGASPGSAGRNRTLAIDRFAELRIPLPPPSEQRRVATKLDRVFDRLGRFATPVALSEARVASLLRALRANLLSQLEMAGHKVEQLDAVAYIEMGQSPPGYAYSDDSTGLPLLNGPTEFGWETPAPRQWTSVVTKACEPGDLLFSVRASIGRMNWADRRYCIGRGLAAIRPRGDGVLPRFLRHVLAAQARRVMELTAGSTFPNLPGAKLAGLPVPVPPLDTQREIADSLDRQEGRIRSLEVLRERALKLRASLEVSVLNRAFGGEL